MDMLRVAADKAVVAFRRRSRPEALYVSTFDAAAKSEGDIFRETFGKQHLNG